MSRSACAIALTAEEVAALKEFKRYGRHGWRAEIVLFAAAGYSNIEIVRATGRDKNVVGTWRARYAALGIAGLRDLPRSGRPTKHGGAS